MKPLPLLLIVAAAIAGVQLTCAQIIARAGSYHSATNSVIGSNSAPAYVLQATNYPKARLVPVPDAPGLSRVQPPLPGTNSLFGTNRTPLFVFNGTNSYLLDGTNLSDGLHFPVLNSDRISPNQTLKPGIYQSEPYAMRIVVPGADATADSMGTEPSTVSPDPLNLRNPDQKLKPVPLPK